MTTSFRDPRVTAIEERVGDIVSNLQEQYVRSDPTPYSRRVLAELRRAVGKPVEDCLDLLVYVADPKAPTAPGSPADDDPTPSERAGLAALSLYALHQQSKSVRMHRDRDDFGFGGACGYIKGPAGAENPGVVRRFRALSTSSSLEELTHHARGLVQLMRRVDVGFDYGRFAADLLLFQIPERRDGVLLRWGRDFYRAQHPSDTGAEAAGDDAGADTADS